MEIMNSFPTTCVPIASREEPCCMLMSSATHSQLNHPSGFTMLPISPWPSHSPKMKALERLSRLQQPQGPGPSNSQSPCPTKPLVLSAPAIFADAGVAPCLSFLPKVASCSSLWTACSRPRQGKLDGCQLGRAVSSLDATHLGLCYGNMKRKSYQQ